MYITQRYWGEFLGGTDDSLTLLDYLATKGKAEIPLGEIFADFGVDRLEGDFQCPGESLAYENGEGYEMSIDCAVDFITDLAALLLECKISGGLDTRELEMDTQLKVLRIPAGEKDLAVVRKALDAFIADPLGCELADMVPEEDLREMAALCGELREEL